MHFESKIKKKIRETLAYTNPPYVLRYQPVLTANLSAVARLSNSVLFSQIYVAQCGCAKAGSWPA